MKQNFLRFLTIATISLAVSGCVSLPRDSFTQAEQAAASPSGFQHIRYVQDDPQLEHMLKAALGPNLRSEINVLALSGGGANGAFGAGVLCQWTQTGTRPSFDLVTGVSTGALIAPFAFLGSSRNEDLRQAYLSSRLTKLLQSRGLRGLFTPGLFSSAPLHALVKSYVTDDLIKAIAVEHAKGRRLLVATTNLDTEQMIVWDMGAIASQGGAEARQLFAGVLVASASIPGVFAPALIHVQGQGRAFREMHVDGQAEGAFFAVPQTMLLAKTGEVAPVRVHLFIIVNGQLEDVFAMTPRSTIPILTRTLDVANKSSIRSVILSTVEFCRHNNCEVRLTALPKDTKDAPLDFSADHLNSLFRLGEAVWAAGDGWKAEK